jgi:hypothetical protein
MEQDAEFRCLLICSHKNSIILPFKTIPYVPQGCFGPDFLRWKSVGDVPGMLILALQLPGVSLTTN